MDIPFVDGSFTWSSNKTLRHGLELTDSLFLWIEKFIFLI
jgi:hypothetical protein